MPSSDASTVPAEPSVVYKRIAQLLAGAGSGAITKTSVAPLERIKILFQIQGMHPELPPKYTSIVGTIRTVIKEEGFVGLYKGNGANVIRIIPNYALKFAFNDTFKDMVRPKGQSGPLSFSQMMAAGSLTGLFQLTLTYPLDMIFTRLSLAEGVTHGVRYKGIIDCAQKTLAHEGASAFYKGIGPTWISGIPYIALQMTFYEVYKDWAPKNKEGKTSVVTKLLAGSAAVLTAQGFCFPGDTIRRRMQTNGLDGQKRIYKNSFHAVTQTVKNEGIPGLYKGMSANIIRVIPGAAIQFAAYDWLKSMLGVTGGDD